MKKPGLRKYVVPVLVNAVLLLLLGLFVWWCMQWYGVDKGVYQYYFPRAYEIVYGITSHGFWFFLLLLALLPVINYFFFRRLGEVKGYWVSCATFLLCALLLELGLRLTGFVPGFVGSRKWFKPVDNLVELEGFFADSLGIVRVHPSQGAFVDSCMAAQKKLTSGELADKGYIYEIACITNDYLDLPDNAFARHLNRIASKPHKTDLDSAVLAYSRHPINADGFRSIPFKKYGTHAPSVLLLGDSFVWGHSTTNKTNSFADELLAKGYAVYNSGITGTDPAQYLAVANLYVPRLEPDAVVLNFFIGNDVLYYNRELKPGRPAFYATNAGNLMVCPEGVCFPDARSAYEFQLRMESIPRVNAFNRFCSFSALGTLFWKFCKRLGWVKIYHETDKEFERQAMAIRKPYIYSAEQVKQVARLCEANGCAFYLNIFPDLGEFGQWKTTGSVPGLFTDMTYHIKPYTHREYNLGDNHLNDLGNRNFAVFLDSLLQHGTK